MCGNLISWTVLLTDRLHTSYFSSLYVRISPLAAKLDLNVIAYYLYSFLRRMESSKFPSLGFLRMPSFLFILPSLIIGVYDIVIAVAKTIKPTIRIPQVMPAHFQVSGVLDPTMTATAKIAIAINTSILPTCITT